MKVLTLVISVSILILASLNVNAGQIYVPDGMGNVNIYSTYENNGTIIVQSTETYDPGQYNPTTPGY